MKATHDEATFTLTGNMWSATYPLDELPKWLAFYRRQKARFPKAGDSYDGTIAALEALAKDLGVSISEEEASSPTSGTTTS
ncbi:hypothetical protein [Paracoccus sp. DMF]|uniref:hypothetical protein n=1 Tax=Paracoccus sp. DMF TaxID=400837 RepID=UPI0011005FBB|nr:hypothetical protein [Paracoccus sp. DMF]MCV2448443.1 hypothetical protein [Paracoccus sp. DMF]